MVVEIHTHLTLDGHCGSTSSRLHSAPPSVFAVFVFVKRQFQHCLVGYLARYIELFVVFSFKTPVPVLPYWTPAQFIYAIF